MQLHINEFDAGQITAAYTVDSESFDGAGLVVIGRGGNAVLLQAGEREVVVSAPRQEGDVCGLLGATNAPAVDLSRFFA